MNIGLFTDTYFPQVSGVATSIKTLKDTLERKGHSVYIFTTTDPHVDKNAIEPNIFRFPSVPFVSFTDRRIAVRGLFHAYHVAKELKLDIVHTQTEFSMGYIGKFVAKNLKIPCIHTYHTMYEDYLHYVLNGHLLKPYHVKQFTKAYLYHVTGVIAPSCRVINKLNDYGVRAPIRIIPTGIDLKKYAQPMQRDLRAKYHLRKEQPALLTVSRVAYEKKINVILDAMPQLVARYPDLQLFIVGDGPAMTSLQEQVQQLHMNNHVVFVGEVEHRFIADYYHMANLLVSASDSEAQGLTYIEAMATGLKPVVLSSEYTDNLLDNLNIGATYHNQAEMIKAISNYLDHPQQFADPQPRLRKLNTISADHFGDQVLKFYHDMQHFYRLCHDDQ
ncbi:MAG: glycosyltransferase family 4 protein [Candidatus Paralactobacillus gallistercoris]|uniref:Glycosyltransferase family 4 protein n=1 Tax=Candidatus Paralactobacillus gallistercoris TaxID=2838724 RepID=A0A948TK57_9LACO|nr:glycosyltransferase family 4 protein [Candidatus Paralactobacillus gallistercoris]